MLEKGFFFQLFLLSRTFLALLHSPFVSYVAFVEVKDTYSSRGQGKLYFD